MTIRYSPNPIEMYGATLRVQRIGAPDSEVVVGPHTSAILAQDPEAWNLAFLSFPFEEGAAPKDPQFSVHVRRTLQVNARTGQLDITETGPGPYVRLILQSPPLRAVRQIFGLPPNVVRSLPLYVAYGIPWLELIQKRASMLASMQDPDNDIFDVSQAAEYLTKFTGGVV